MAQAGVRRRHHRLCRRSAGVASVAEPARMGCDDGAQHRHQPARRRGAVVRERGLHRAPDAERAMTALAHGAARAEERRAIVVAGGAHALHDGYTDLIYVMLPVWQAEFGLTYAAL